VDGGSALNQRPRFEERHSRYAGMGISGRRQAMGVRRPNSLSANVSPLGSVTAAFRPDVHRLGFFKSLTRPDVKALGNSQARTRAPFSRLCISKRAPVRTCKRFDVHNRRHGGRSSDLKFHNAYTAAVKAIVRYQTPTRRPQKGLKRRPTRRQSAAARPLRAMRRPEASCSARSHRPRRTVRRAATPARRVPRRLAGLPRGLHPSLLGRRRWGEVLFNGISPCDRPRRSPGPRVGHLRAGRASGSYQPGTARG
jgi:hypothetical protein